MSSVRESILRRVMNGGLPYDSYKPHIPRAQLEEAVNELVTEKLLERDHNTGKWSITSLGMKELDGLTVKGLPTVSKIKCRVCYQFDCSCAVYTG